MAQDLTAKKLNFASRMQSAFEQIETARATLRALKVESVDNGWTVSDFTQEMLDNTGLKHLTPAILVAGISAADALDGTGTGALSATHRQTIARFRG